MWWNLKLFIMWYLQGIISNTVRRQAIGCSWVFSKLNVFIKAGPTITASFKTDKQVMKLRSTIFICETCCSGFSMIEQQISAIEPLSWWWEKDALQAHPVQPLWLGIHSLAEELTANDVSDPATFLRLTAPCNCFCKGTCLWKIIMSSYEQSPPPAYLSFSSSSILWESLLCKHDSLRRFVSPCISAVWWPHLSIKDHRLWFNIFALRSKWQYSAHLQHVRKCWTFQEQGLK